MGGGIFHAQEEVHHGELWAEIGFIDIPGIVDVITHTIILNSMELFDLKGDLL